MEVIRLSGACSGVLVDMENAQFIFLGFIARQPVERKWVLGP